MAKVTVTARLDLLDRLEGKKPFILTSDLEDIGKVVVATAKQMIASGQSPVAGWGRFEAYASQRSGAKAKIAKKDARNIKKLFGNTKAVKKVTAHAKSLTSAAARKYPFSVMKKYPDKKVRPVNLSLSGEMLKLFNFEVISKTQVNIGLINASGKIETIAIAHNEGPTNNAFPQRKFIATKDGEDYAVSIQREIKRIFSAAIERVLNESNK